jgi:hypothetical protein
MIARHTGDANEKTCREEDAEAPPVHHVSTAQAAQKLRGHDMSWRFRETPRWSFYCVLGFGLYSLCDPSK